MRARAARAPVRAPVADANLALPAAELLRKQAAWLAPARAWLLRDVAIARRRSVLDLGAGYGAVTAELTRRAGGRVTALDCAVDALQGLGGAVGGDARGLPFAAGTFDLVFSQLTLLWVAPLAAALDELARVLAPGGALVALEPDYGGLIESPPEAAARELWLAALPRAGADPLVGRKLPGLLAARGFDVRVRLFDTLYAPSPARFDFLDDLPLTSAERARLADLREAAATLPRPWEQVAHLPFFLITATRQG